MMGGGGLSYVPREKDENRADRHLTDETLEPFLRLTVRVLQCLIADLEHILGTLDRRGHW